MKNHTIFPKKLKKTVNFLESFTVRVMLLFLKIQTYDPYLAGYTQGYLLQKPLSDILHNIKFVLLTLSRQKRASEISKALAAIKPKIPEPFLKELTGLTDGYNARKRIYEKKINLDDLLLLQLMPDATYTVCT